ncbi:hypothetical protein C8F04DRAFT_1275283 [Mycena alexandri]|uniref:Uncharacterized protein n=1 Tax=Mycena alexandri TaxID=1745969 RepID=A0AAD6S3C2_9AGAR|nr:hypothetical protein C8F04DRAFT_1275283 [Mycena alexandri]
MKLAWQIGRQRPLDALQSHPLHWQHRSCYSLLAQVFTLLTYFHTLENARILLVADTSKLALSTLTAALALFVSLIGYPGILLNSRLFLALHTFLLWIASGLLVVPGYITYKHRTLNLEAKVNQQWSQELGAACRLTIQSVLGCSIMAAGLLCSNHVTYLPLRQGHDAKGLSPESRGDGGDYGAVCEGL